MEDEPPKGAPLSALQRELIKLLVATAAKEFLQEHESRQESTSEPHNKETA